ncbi:hypothetical protein A6R68_13080, partial [Neotoma lepida]
MSLLNHSCDPNCSIVFNGPHLLLRAVREIEAGEELTICYLDMLMTSEERRKQLRDQYCFECDCIRCQTQDKSCIDASNASSDVTSGRFPKDVFDHLCQDPTLLRKLGSLVRSDYWPLEVLAIISSNSERLPDINIYQLKVLDCAMDACINLGMLEEALFYAMRTMEPYRPSEEELSLFLFSLDEADTLIPCSPKIFVSRLPKTEIRQKFWSVSRTEWRGAAPHSLVPLIGRWELDVSAVNSLASGHRPSRSASSLPYYR